MFNDVAWRRRMTAAVCFASLFCIALPAQAETAAKTAPDARYGAELAAPDLSDAIPLRAAVKRAKPEQWARHGVDSISVRNVVNPTLTPFLPDKDKATGAAVIVAPGGAFRMLSIDEEGFKVARWLADHGVAAFVLKYRTVPTPRDPAGYQAAMQAFMQNVPGDDALDTPKDALEDAVAAMRLVRKRADEWGVDPKRVGFIGFSAGAMTALSVGLIHDKASRPDFIAPIYPPMSARETPADAPPMFVAIALDDPLFAAGKPLGLIDSWRTARRPVEAHLYERGGHGFGMVSTKAAAAMWIDQFFAWMKDRGVLEAQTFSSARSTIGEMLDNPQARAVLEKHLPEIVNSPNIDQTRPMTLADLRRYAPQVVTDEKMAAIDQELAALEE